MKSLIAMLVGVSKGRLSLRLLVYVLICSSILALLVSIIQLYIEYRRDVSRIDANMLLIKKSYIESISASTYSMDYNQLNVLLEGLLKVEGIVFLEVSETVDNKKVIVATQGQKVHRDDIVREFALSQPYTNTLPADDMQFATLRVSASLEWVYQSLADRAVIVVLINLFKTLLASSVIFIIFQRAITRHLVNMADFTQDISLTNLGRSLILKRKPSRPENADELDRLVASINSMQYKMASDIHERQELEATLSYQASHDGLTGLINRREFERLAKELFDTMESNPSEHVFCFMDLDRFKIVNDTCGHAAGDDLLRQISQLLLNSVRAEDVVIRFGGDEFGVLFSHCTFDHARSMARRILNSVQAFQFIWEGQVFKVGVSIGLVPINQSNANLKEVLRNADSACYIAKDRGRNRIHEHRDDDIDTSRRHGEMQWVVRISDGLEHNRFHLFGQTIQPLGNNPCKRPRCEILLRMLSEDGDLIPPGVFIPVAENYQLISKIDCWVVENTFDMLTQMHDLKSSMDLFSINLSGQSIGSREVLDHIVDLFNSYKIDGSKICFEITETAAITNLNLALHFIERLKKLGCKFALDDFGSGLSSFAYLKNLDVDFLKIDGMFVKNIVDNTIDRAMVKSINDIGHSLGLQTVAEFVETEEIRGLVNDIGIDFAQGYLYDQPLPLSRLNNTRMITASGI